MKRWGNRFLSSTRGQVVALLRRGKATVNELARSLELTDNAVRAHLNTLERDGLVQPAGKRPGVRKPEALFALTTEAELLFPKSYDALLNQLLTVLAERSSPAEVEEILVEVGQRLGRQSEADTAGESLRERAERGSKAIQGLGGLAEVRETPEGLVIHGFSCPLASAVTAHRQVCRLAEALLGAVVGQPVHEACDHSGGVPRCRFLIPRQGAEEAG